MLDVSSPTTPIDFSKAQGGSLGPLMFIVCTNDLVRISIEIYYIKYANDTTLYILAVVIGKCISSMNQCLSQ